MNEHENMNFPFFSILVDEFIQNNAKNKIKTGKKTNLKVETKIVCLNAIHSNVNDALVFRYVNDER